MKYITKGEDNKTQYFFVEIKIKEIISQVRASIIGKLLQQFKSEGKEAIFLQESDFKVLKDKILIKLYKSSKVQ